MSKPSMSRVEFVALTASLLSLVALSIDAMLPALDQIGSDLGVSNKDTQLMVSSIFFGLAISQMFYGPISDSFGRKPAIYLGLAVYLGGTLVALVAPTFEVMLVGRVLQGVGAAGPKIVMVAVVRDQYAGARMAKIMSLVMAVFVVVPALAPALGQGILYLAPWKAIFVFFAVLGTICLAWFGVRQEESLDKERRLPFQPRRILAAAREALTTPVALGYTIAAGLVFGGFLAYLNSAQPIFQEQYQVGEHFALYFGGLALVLGTASMTNSRLVERFGMYALSLRAVWVLVVASAAFSIPALLCDGDPPLWSFVAYLVCAFFPIGMLFGNFNAMAMEPLGHIAGTASAVIASLSTFISLGAGMYIGRAFDGTVLPLNLGILACSVAGLPILYLVRRHELATHRQD